VSDVLISNLIMPASNPALVAGPLANRAPGAQGPTPSGAQPPVNTAGGQTFAHALRAQLQQSPQAVTAQDVVVETAIPALQRGIIAARASPEIPALGVLTSASALTELNAAAAESTGKNMPADGNVLPELDLPMTIDELPASTPVTVDLPRGEIPLSPAQPNPLPATVTVDSRPDIMATNVRSAAPIGHSMPTATFVENSSLFSQTEQAPSMTGNSGGQSANADSDTPNSSYRAMDPTLTFKVAMENAPGTATPKFTLPADAAMVSASQLPSSLTGSATALDLTDLPQMSSTRGLQPNADPDLFSKGLSNRLMMMSQDGVQSARLKLHPEYLGPLDVRIRIEDDGAHVWFGAQHGQTREALEAAIPRLRELFADQGLQLVRADVSSGQSGEHGDDGSLNKAELDAGLRNEGSSEMADAMTALTARVSERLLDVYV
jgi:flagellar hook-length control protein FliK